VVGYSGDAGDALQYQGDWRGDGMFGNYYHNGMKFTTNNRDNDRWSGDCSLRGGGWWFNECYWACLTCEKNEHYDWQAQTLLANSRMMIKPQ